MRARIGASILLAGALAITLTACATPQTQQPYAASDGVNVEVGDVRLLNTLVVTDGEDGNLLATAVNTGDQDVRLRLQYDAGGGKTDLTVAIPAGQTVDLGFGPEGQLLLPAIGVPAGGLLELYVQYGSVPGVLAHVPVLDDSFDYYGRFLPTPTPEPEEPAEDETPAPTPTS